MHKTPIHDVAASYYISYPFFKTYIVISCKTLCVPYVCTLYTVGTGTRFNIVTAICDKTDNRRETF